MKKLWISICLMPLLFCCGDNLDQTNVTTNGMKPIYKTITDLYSISSEEPRSFGQLGKIVSSGRYIFINERFEGIHVIDNADPSNPTKIHFWQIPGNIDFTIKGQYLYAENTTDLLTIDISDPANIILGNTLEDIYETQPVNNVPPDYSGAFECVDPTKGIVIDWERASLTDPKCRI